MIGFRSSETSFIKPEGAQVPSGFFIDERL